MKMKDNFDLKTLTRILPTKASGKLYLYDSDMKLIQEFDDREKMYLSDKGELIIEQASSLSSLESLKDA